MTDERFAMTPETLILELTASELRMYCFLDLKQGSDPRFAVDRPLGWIAGQLGIHPQTAAKAVESLKRKGIVAVRDVPTAEKTTKGERSKRVEVLHNPARGKRSEIIDLITADVLETRRNVEAREAKRKAQNVARWANRDLDARENIAAPTRKNRAHEELTARDETARIPRSDDVRVGLTENSLFEDCELSTEPEFLEEPEHLTAERSEYLAALNAGFIAEPSEDEELAS